MYLLREKQETLGSIQHVAVFSTKTQHLKMELEAALNTALSWATKPFTLGEFDEVLGVLEAILKYESSDWDIKADQTVFSFVTVLQIRCRSIQNANSQYLRVSKLATLSTLLMN